MRTGRASRVARQLNTFQPTTSAASGADDVAVRCNPIDRRTSSVLPDTQGTGFGAASTSALPASALLRRQALTPRCRSKSVIAAVSALVVLALMVAVAIPVDMSSRRAEEERQAAAAAAAAAGIDGSSSSSGGAGSVSNVTFAPSPTSTRTPILSSPQISSPSPMQPMASASTTSAAPLSATTAPPASSTAAAASASASPASLGSSGSLTASQTAPPAMPPLCVWRKLQGLRAVVWTGPAGLNDTTPCDKTLPSDLGCNAWWRRDEAWAAYTRTRNATLAMMRFALAVDPHDVAATSATAPRSAAAAGLCTAASCTDTRAANSTGGVIVYFSAFLADPLHGGIPLARLATVVTDLFAAGMQVIILLGRPEFAGEGSWATAANPVNDAPRQALLLSYVRAVASLPAVRARVRFLSVYWMGLSSFCDNDACSTDAVAAYTSSIAATVKAAGGNLTSTSAPGIAAGQQRARPRFGYLHHVDGPLWEAHYAAAAAAQAAGVPLNTSWGMRGHGPQSLAAARTGADGMLAECWLQGSLVAGVRSFGDIGGYRVASSPASAAAAAADASPTIPASLPPSTSSQASTAAVSVSASIDEQYPSCPGSDIFDSDRANSTAGTQFLLVTAVPNCADEDTATQCVISPADPRPDIAAWFAWVQSQLQIAHTWAVWEWLTVAEAGVNTYGHSRRNGTEALEASVAVSAATLGSDGVVHQPSASRAATNLSAATMDFLTLKGQAFASRAIEDANS